MVGNRPNAGDGNVPSETGFEYEYRFAEYEYEYDILCSLNVHGEKE